VILRAEDKFRDREDIDKAVTTELPDRAHCLRLHATVTRSMIHGPGGTLDPRAPCMENGKCTKDFPKDFSDATLENVNGYPLYRRGAIQSLFDAEIQRTHQRGNLFQRQERQISVQVHLKRSRLCQFGTARVRAEHYDARVRQDLDESELALRLSTGSC
jgi:hypothetical protein